MRCLLLVLLLAGCSSRLPDIAEAKDAYERSYETMCTWNSVASATGYRVFAGRTSRGESGWEEYEIVCDAGTRTFYIFPPTFKSSARYFFSVRAYNELDESEYSVEVSKFLD